MGGEEGGTGLWEPCMAGRGCRGSSPLALLGADKGDQPPPQPQARVLGQSRVVPKMAAPGQHLQPPGFPRPSPVASSVSRQGQVLGGSGLGPAGCLLCFLKLPSVSFFCFLLAAFS